MPTHGHFPLSKGESDFTFQRSVKKTVVEHLGQFDFLHSRKNVVMLGRPGPARPTKRSGSRACLAGQRVAFATTTSATKEPRLAAACLDLAI